MGDIGLTIRKSVKVRTLATVTDAPLDKKVEMTNWEKVWHSRNPNSAAKQNIVGTYN